LSCTWLTPPLLGGEMLHCDGHVYVLYEQEEGGLIPREMHEPLVGDSPQKSHRSAAVQEAQVL